MNKEQEEPSITIDFGPPHRISAKAEKLEDELSAIMEVENELPNAMPLVGMYFITRVVPTNSKTVKRVIVGSIVRALHGDCYLMNNLVHFGDGKSSKWLSVIHIMELQKGFRLYDDRARWLEAVGKSKSL